MKKSERVSSDDRKTIKLLKWMILLTLVVGVFVSSYIFGLKIVNDSKINEKSQDSISNLLDKAKPAQ